jgi:3-mercaptopyruvate sulfurtransferase SseA
MTTLIDVDRLAAVRNRYSIVDVRPVWAYNGWKVGSERRGGHIPGAVPFPGAWARDRDDDALLEALGRCGVDSVLPLVVYGDTEAEAREVAVRLEGAAVLAGGFAAWSNRRDTPVDRLACHRRLVHPRWLADALNGEAVEHPPAKKLLVLHATSDRRAEYEQGHIPGALHVDTLSLESPRDWNRRTPPEIDAAVRSLGIRSSATVVLYGRDSFPEGGRPHAGRLAAARVASILMYAGVDDVRILDGGLEAWTTAGYGLESGTNDPVPVASFGASVPANPSVFVDADGAERIIADQGAELVSIRSLPEHEGRSSGYDYIEGMGDIPGAIWGDSGSDAQHMENYRNEDGTMLDYERLRARWLEKGITGDKRIAFYCGTGWRASEAFFDAHVMGWNDISVYDGGWLEWSRRRGPNG